MSSDSQCKRPERRFPWYAVLLYVGLVTALVVADRLARAKGVDAVRLVLAFALTMPACLAGARALEVALQWRYYRARPAEILRVSAGGAAMYGGLPPALLLSIPLARWVGIPLGLFWDIALVAIVAGMVPTRFGCLGAGCCAGRETSSKFALHLRNACGRRAQRHPVQLWEASLGAVLFAAGLLLWGRTPFPGALALLLAAGYGAGRFALDGLREERGPRLAGAGAYRWMSAALCGVGACGLALGSSASVAESAWSVPLSSAGGGALHLVLSALLLLPVVRLFRFLGCLTKPEFNPGVRYLLQMIVVVPDLGTGPVAARMQFLSEPSLTEIGDSPFELEPAGVEPDGRLRAETLAELPGGAYTVNCTVSRADAITRVGTCSGTLDSIGLVVAFQANPNHPPTVLQPRLCFQSP